MKFIYPIDIDATFSVDNGTVTNNYRVHDQAIDLGASMSVDDRLQWDFDSSLSPDSCAIYVLSGSGTVDITTASGTEVRRGNESITAGWNVITIPSGTSIDWYIEIEASSSLVIAEAFFAYEFDFPYRYDLGHTEQSTFGVDVTTGMGGGEFANKRHGEKTLRNWNWRSFSETNKTDYKTMLTAISGTYAKVLWYDDSSYHFVRLQDTPIFTEETFQIYNLGQGTRSQLQ